MAKITIYNQEGTKVNEYNAAAAIFEAEFNRDLIQQALIRQLSNKRLGMIAHTKTKAEIVGGKKKPFRQKGTGYARQGATNNPHQIGGGVAHGPRNVRNFQKDMPKKQRRLALFSAISQKLREEKVLGLDKYDQAEIKTRKMAEMINKLPIDKDVLIVLDSKNEMLTKSANNLPNVKTINVQYLNIADLQKFDKIVFLEEALKKMESIFLNKN
ncbi:50S ribosomal protein L4 [Candidatus Peregrinibacteria bacterium]|nr:50S ribosomal protein L4 [Candidatus Peregrinibacteria bacterium]